MSRVAAADRPVRIAFVSEHASPVALLGSQDAGGQNVYVDEVSRQLGRLGYAVDIFTRRDDRDAPEIIEWAANVRVVNLLAGPPEFVVKDALWPLMPAFRDALLEFAVRNNVAYDLLHGNFWMSGWVVAEVSKRLGIPAVQIFHAMGKTKQLHQGTADTSPDGRIEVEQHVITAVDRLIAQCPSERDELVEDYGADPHKVALIPSAVNVERFRPVQRDEARQHIGLDTDELVIGYIGRMMPRKDVRNLLRAAALLVDQTDVPLITPELGVLQQLAAELGIADRVRFVGKRQPDVLRYYYSSVDVVVTTPWYEPFGLTPLEGMACGRPVIGSAVGGITYTIADGETGLLVPPRDPAALADALRHLLTQTARREQMGRAARQRVEREFTWATVAERTAALYQTLLQAGTTQAVDAREASPVG
jgi:glycosyltransferase involved in cell wall biosynthesis